MSDRWNLCRLAWCDYMMLQYGFGKTETQIETMTESAMNDLNKPVVAGEYSLSSERVSVKLGNAAVSVGAKGFGNGGAGAAAAAPEKIWQAEGLDEPESAVLDTSGGVLYVSNVNGDASAADGNGYISKLSLEGEILDKEWLTGLNAPKGLRSTRASSTSPTSKSWW